MRSIRGATTVENNDENEILKATEEMLTAIIEENCLNINDIISVIFTCTRDLDQVYPAVAARSIGLTQAALMCFAELYVEGSMNFCIRVSVNAETDIPQSAVRHVYLNRAKALRPDITGANTEGAEKKHFSIALDGPSGAGKSTVAKICAERLGLSYIDTGAMYRAFGYFCFVNGIDVENTLEIDKASKIADVEVKFIDGAQHVFSGGEDVTEKIRSQEIAEYASKVSAVASVRKWLVKIQQDLAKGNNVIMDGRDIGTVVLKDSPLKIYLDASSEIRARRRVNELISSGREADFETVHKEVIDRDFRDMNRESDPLKKADDAVVITSDNMSAEEVCGVICSLSRKRMA